MVLLLCPKFSFGPKDQKFTSHLVKHFRCTRKTNPTLQFTQQKICTAESGFLRPEKIFIYLTVTYLYPVVNCKYKNALSCKHAVLLTLSPLDVHLNQNHHVHNALLHRPIMTLITARVRNRTTFFDVAQMCF